MSDNPAPSGLIHDYQTALDKINAADAERRAAEESGNEADLYRAQRHYDKALKSAIKSELALLVFLNHKLKGDTEKIARAMRRIQTGPRVGADDDFKQFWEDSVDVFLNDDRGTTSPKPESKSPVKSQKGAVEAPPANTIGTPGGQSPIPVADETPLSAHINDLLRIDGEIEGLIREADEISAALGDPYDEESSGGNVRLEEINEIVDRLFRQREQVLLAISDGPPVWEVHPPENVPVDDDGSKRFAEELDRLHKEFDKPPASSAIEPPPPPEPPDDGDRLTYLRNKFHRLEQELSAAQQQRDEAYRQSRNPSSNFHAVGAQVYKASDAVEKKERELNETQTALHQEERQHAMAINRAKIAELQAKIDALTEERDLLPKAEPGSYLANYAPTRLKEIDEALQGYQAELDYQNDLKRYGENPGVVGAPRPRGMRKWDEIRASAAAIGEPVEGWEFAWPMAPIPPDPDPGHEPGFLPSPVKPPAIWFAPSAKPAAASPSSPDKGSKAPDKPKGGGISMPAGAIATLLIVAVVLALFAVCGRLSSRSSNSSSTFRVYAVTGTNANYVEDISTAIKSYQESEGVVWSGSNGDLNVTFNTGTPTGTSRVVVHITKDGAYEVAFGSTSANGEVDLKGSGGEPYLLNFTNEFNYTTTYTGTDGGLARTDTRTGTWRFDKSMKVNFMGKTVDASQDHREYTDVERVEGYPDVTIQVKETDLWRSRDLLPLGYYQTSVESAEGQVLAQGFTRASMHGLDPAAIPNAP